MTHQRCDDLGLTAALHVEETGGEILTVRKKIKLNSALRWNLLIKTYFHCEFDMMYDLYHQVIKHFSYGPFTISN